MRLTIASCFLTLLAASTSAQAQTLTNEHLKVQVGKFGELSSLQIVGDAFATNYVLNASNAPAAIGKSAEHAWVGELMFSVRSGSGAYATALTSQSDDVRRITSSADAITVTYEGAKSATGIRNFELVEAYQLDGDALRWNITLTNTGSAPLEFGDVGLPLPFNEYFGGGDVIYEQRVVYHSFVGQGASYLTIKRPSGVGPFLLLLPDASTGAGFEYKDNWIPEEHPNSAWAAGAWPTGLEVYYVHGDAIAKTHRGYLPTTSLTLAAGETRSYGFKFAVVADEDAVKARLYSEGLIDVTVAPGMIVSTEMTAKFDLHTSKAIVEVTADAPSDTDLVDLGESGDDHHLYAVKFAKLGANDLHVRYGDGEQTTLQFYVIEAVGDALQRHATFMVEHTQWSSGDLAGVFDDWMMDAKSKRGATGGWGWGDDWGWTHAEFLAEKNAQSPVASEVAALDVYLDAVWGRAIDPATFTVQDWWCPPGTSASNIANCFYDRGFAYPHAFNTYLSMYRVATRYPALTAYHQSADTYLMRAYGIFRHLFPGEGVAGTGFMGEQTVPELSAALRAAGHTKEADIVDHVVSLRYQGFKAQRYPYGSEYSYDNTGEEAVYMAARVAGDSKILAQVDAKTRACRGQEPVWYWYADPVTINGEGWWQFQYSTALNAYGMDDWVRHHSPAPERDERLAYAAKLANVSAINSGQIDADPANLGTIAWTYQAMKGDFYRGSAEGNGKLHNGWREMAGEADLGLFAALRVLSADVAVDPIFGVLGYGCDVQTRGACYAVTPLDGVFKRLNLITEKLHMELDRDRYQDALVSIARDHVSFTLRNQTLSAHETNVTFEGLAAGAYPVSVDGAETAMLTVVDGTPAVLTLSIGSAMQYAIQVGDDSACQAAADAGAAADGAVRSPQDAGSDGGRSGSAPAAGEQTAHVTHGGCSLPPRRADAGLAAVVFTLLALRTLRRRRA